MPPCLNHCFSTIRILSSSSIKLPLSLMYLYIFMCNPSFVRSRDQNRTLLFVPFSFVFISHLTNFRSLLCLCMYVYLPNVRTITIIFQNSLLMYTHSVYNLNVFNCFCLICWCLPVFHGRTGGESQAGRRAEWRDQICFDQRSGHAEMERTYGGWFQCMLRPTNGHIFIFSYFHIWHKLPISHFHWKKPTIFRYNGKTTVRCVAWNIMSREGQQYFLWIKNSPWKCFCLENILIKVTETLPP